MSTTDLSIRRSPNNPYLKFGVSGENWQRGYDGMRFIGLRGSDAWKFYKEGRAPVAPMIASRSDYSPTAQGELHASNDRIQANRARAG